MSGFSLSKKALVAGLLILLPVTITFIYSYINNRDHLKEKVLDEMTIIAEAYEGQVYQFLEMSKREARHFSSDGFIRARVEEIIKGNGSATLSLNKHLLKNKRPVDKVIVNIHVLSLDGHVISSTDSSVIGEDLSNEPFFKNGISETTVTEYYTGKVKTPQLAISSPILGIETGMPIGVIVNFIYLSELNELMTGEYNRGLGAISWRRGKFKTMEVYLVNRDKLMLTDSLFVKDAVLRQLVNTTPVNECLKANKEVSAFYKDYRGVNMAGASNCLPAMKWTLLVETDEKELITPLNVMIKTSIIAGIIVAGLIIVLFILFFRRVVKPIVRLSEEAKKVAKGNYNITIPIKTSDEIGTLVDSFNNMACDIKTHTEALAKSEQKYRTLFEESKDVVMIGTPDDRVLDVNPAGLELLGYSSKEEMLKLNIARNIYKDSIERDRFKKEAEKYGFVKDFELVLKRKDGELVNAIVSANVVRDEKGDIIAYRGIIHDMTAYKRLELQLLQAQKLEAIGQLTAGIAHDFNNILTAIIGNAAIIKMKAGKDSILIPFIQQIVEVSERAASLTQSLLAFSKKQVIYKRPIPLNDVIKRIEKLLLRLIGEDIDLRVQLTETDITIMADEGQIEQVLLNLATNARDAMPRGGVLSLNTILIDLKDEFMQFHGYGNPGTYALLSVTDTGEGMDESTIEKIFDPFFSTKEVGKGTGLGLSTVYGIIKQHEGFIDVNSKPGKGTTFNIYLPIIQTGIREPEMRRDMLLRGGDETLLLAEDEAHVRSITKTVIEGFGYNVIEAVNGDDALAKFTANKDRIKLLILDVVMPKKTGIEVYNEIKRLSSEKVKTIFISGYNDEVSHKKEILEDGLDFLSKPVAPTELLIKIREILDQ